MNRLDEVFRKKETRILSVYITAGYPRIDNTIKVVRSLEAAGADMVEIGMPFSDPLADGPVIQESSQIALRNGMSLTLLFEQLHELRSQVSIPVILMGYLNPVLRFGLDRFIELCRDTGVDGVILPDLPLAEFNDEYREKFARAGIAFSMLITPQTSEQRIRDIAASTSGFLYMVSDASTTGAKKGISEAQLEYFSRIREMELEIPRLVGFGISNASSFSKVCDYANGAIIGSAFISALSEAGDAELEQVIQEFVQERIFGQPR